METADAMERDPAYIAEQLRFMHARCPVRKAIHSPRPAKAKAVVSCSSDRSVCRRIFA